MKTARLLALALILFVFSAAVWVEGIEVVEKTRRPVLATIGYDGMALGLAGLGFFLAYLAFKKKK